MSKNCCTFAVGNGFSAQSMKRLTNILFLLVPLWCLFSYAQTPFDSFAPESSRPMLDLDFIRARNAYHAQKAITTATILYFVDITNGNIIASVPLTDELRKWLSVDPLSDKYPNISPYAYCAWNPINKIDPDGRDWYEAEDGQIMWTKAHSQEEMQQLNINGKYLDKVVLDYKGSRYETLGWKYPGMEGFDGKHTYGYIDGLFSIPAEVTLYGPRGADDITTGMLGYTMTSDYSTFGAIEQGGYSVKYDEPGKEPPLPSHWLVVGRVPEMDGKPNNSPKAGVNKGFPYKTGIYVHSTNQSGYAGVTIWDPYTGRPQSGISVGCPLLSPKDYKTFENKMAGQKSFWLRITR